ncbi:MAG: MmcQ/YjbR family DNA-binding protein, partial [Acidimicrobiales bacterium]
MAENVLDRLRSVALALPGVEERVSHRAPCFYVGKRAFCRFHDADFGSDDRVAMWCLSPPGVADELAAAEPDRFFQPTPSANGVFADWLGIYL